MLATGQYGNNVIGPGSPQYDDAYFELNYIKGYTLDGVSLLSSSSLNYSSPSSATAQSSATSTGSIPAVSTAAASGAASSGGNSTNSAECARGVSGGGFLAVTGLLVLGLSIM